ncbi:hypothetical protein HDU67_009475 [Dinochytrium kinnereticum]|nr:hypothetical protein HDU67_009475 [Dinochytrium kinnereticum]
MVGSFSTLSSLVLILTAAAGVIASPVPGASTPNVNGPKPITNAELNELRDLTQLSLLSYCVNEIENSKAFNCNVCKGPAASLTCYQPIVSANNATQGYVAVDVSRKTIYLSFQGAVLPSNWFSSFNFPRSQLKFTSPDPNAWVHQGFQSAYHAVGIRSEILKKVSDLVKLYPSFSLHALGHSYGCPISTIAVAELVLSGRIAGSKVSLTTFGSPRIGNYEFARLIDSKLGLSNVRRVTHSYDTVTRVPPTNFGFRHAGREIWIDVESKRAYSCEDLNQSFDESPSCNNKFAVTQWVIDSHNSYFDHNVDTACATVNPLKPVNVGYLPFEVLYNKP